MDIHKFVFQHILRLKNISNVIPVDILNKNIKSLLLYHYLKYRYIMYLEVMQLMGNNFIVMACF